MYAEKLDNSGKILSNVSKKDRLWRCLATHLQYKQFSLVNLLIGISFVVSSIGIWLINSSISAFLSKQIKYNSSISKYS